MEWFLGTGQLVISILVGYVAWQQWLTARDKLQLDRYERRFRIYQVLLDFLGTVSFGKAKQRDVVEFDIAITEAFFLFGKDKTVFKYLSQIRQKADDCNFLQGQAEGVPGPQNPVRTDLVGKIRESQDSLRNELTAARTVFEPYLIQK